MGKKLLTILNQPSDYYGTALFLTFFYWICTCSTNSNRTTLHRVSIALYIISTVQMPVAWGCAGLRSCLLSVVTQLQALRLIASLYYFLVAVRLTITAQLWTSLIYFTVSQKNVSLSLTLKHIKPFLQGLARIKSIVTTREGSRTNFYYDKVGLDIQNIRG